MVGVLGILGGILGVLFGVLVVLVDMFGVLVGIISVLVGRLQNCLRSLDSGDSSFKNEWIIFRSVREPPQKNTFF